ncbi:MAG: hypothetical protein HRU38_08170 [Saccharospirillaceae bacterium]|nr:hypothetical protein [Pseudomonadales bacterium]NRB78629.1 hypothetical protein [Saccharospirillaceae bacterium]
MQFNKVFVVTSSLLMLNLALAKEIEVINAEQEIGGSIQQTSLNKSSNTQLEVETDVKDKVKVKTETDLATTQIKRDQLQSQIVDTVSVIKQPEDDWSLMTQLIANKKQQEAQAKAKIEQLSEVNSDLNEKVVANKQTLSTQEKTISSLELQLNELQTSALRIETQLASLQENTDTVSYEFKKLQFKTATSKLTPFLYGATAILISNQLETSQDTKLILGLAALSVGTLIESTDYGLSFQLTKIVFRK